MRNKNCVKLTEEFLKRKFDESEYFSDKKSEKDYRKQINIAEKILKDLEL